MDAALVRHGAIIQAAVATHRGLLLKARGEGYYTISSAGHENNAVVGARLRITDPAVIAGPVAQCVTGTRPGRTVAHAGSPSST